MHAGRWVGDSRRASPVLVPVLSLGRRVEVTEHAGAAVVAPTASAAGGARLRRLLLSEDLFQASAMTAVRKDLMAMRVVDLKEELTARGETTQGNKAWLRRRLHAAILRAGAEAAARRRMYDLFGTDSEED